MNFGRNKAGGETLTDCAGVNVKTWLGLPLAKGLAFRDRLEVVPRVKVGFQENSEMPVWMLRQTERCRR